MRNLTYAMKVMALVLLSAGLATSSAGATVKFSPNLIQIVRPGHGEGIHTPGAKVKLKVHGRAAVRATIDERDVTRKLHLRVVRRQGKTQILRGTVPRALVAGPPSVLGFTARTKRARGRATVLVQAVRNRRGFLSLKLRRGGLKRPAVAILRTKTHRIYLTAELNGRPVEGVSEATRLGVRRLELTATEGLRRGRNVLVVRANDARGNGTVKRRVFRIRRSVIPGVRSPDQVRSGVPVRLDAGPSKGGPNRKFTYRWRFSARPRGSKAKIRGAKRRVGSFRPDRPGHYAVRLTVRRRGGGKSGKAASASGRKSGASSLTVGVDAQLPIDPYGLQLHVDGSEIVIGETKIPMPTAASSMVLVPIDEMTGVVGNAVTIPANGPNGERDVKGLIAALSQVAPDKLTVIAGVEGTADPDPSVQPGMSYSSSLQFARQLAGLGFEETYDLQTQIVNGSAFALAGSPGNAPGAGVSSPFSGNLDARLRPVGVTKDLIGSLGLEQPDFRLMNIGDASKPMKVSPVDGDSADVALDAPPLADSSAMRVTVINATTLEPVVNATAPASADRYALRAVETLLQQASSNPNALILFKMKATGFYGNRVEMSNVSKALARLGGNRDMFIRSLSYGSNGSGESSLVPHDGSDYVFLGGAGIRQPIEGTAAVAGSPLNADGVMQQDSLGRWVPTASGVGEGMDQDLQALAVRAPVAYRYPNTAAPVPGQAHVPGTDAQYAAAEQQLYKLLVSDGPFCRAAASCPDRRGVRINYGYPTLLKSANLTSAIKALKCGGKVPVAPRAIYSQTQLDALRTMICRELKMMQMVHSNLFEPLAELYSDLRSDESFDLLANGNIVSGYLQLKRDADLAKENKFLGISGEAGAILGELVSVAVEAAEVVLGPETGGGSIFAGKMVAATLGLGTSALSLASETQSAGGDDKVAPEEITVGTLLHQIQRAFGQASSSMEETEAIIVSDPTKLVEAFDNIKGFNATKAPVWDLTKSLPGLPSTKYDVARVIKFQHQLAALQYTLPRMIATVSKPCDVGGSANDKTTYVAWTALRDQGGGTFTFPIDSRLRSVHLTSEGADVVGSYLFGSPFMDSPADSLDTGPTGAALAPSPFFMNQIAPTSTAKLDSWSKCGELPSN